MPQPAASPLRRVAIVGAGNMGAGIAQKFATEGFAVTLVDQDVERVGAGVNRIARTLAEGVERGVVRASDRDEALARVTPSARLADTTGAELVIEAVFEDLRIKRALFTELDALCGTETVLATNTSSFLVADLAASTSHPERVVGLHYFFHPAKNRLVEVVPGPQTSADVFRRAWSLQEALGKTPIASRDSYGFIVNRFFAPWLVEAIRLLDDGVADVPTIEAAARQAFGIGMGPFELMNVTGLPIALHTATTLGRAFGAFYAAPARLADQIASGAPWPLGGEPTGDRIPAAADRLMGAAFLAATALVDEGVGTRSETDIGARVGLRWRRGPFELMNHIGPARAGALAADVARRWQTAVPASLARQARDATPFELPLVHTRLDRGIATITIDRPDAMNALNEGVLADLGAAFRVAADDPAVRGIVIAGSGKAFVAGADVRFFVRSIEAGRLDRIATFTQDARLLLDDLAHCPKPVVARVHGLALGGGVELALACHAIVATSRAVFAFPETGIGIYPGLGGTQRTTRRIGVGLTKWLVLSGERIAAEEALAIGLVDRVEPFEALDAAAAELASMAHPVRRTPRRVPDSHAALAAYFERTTDDALTATSSDPEADGRIEAARARVRANAPVAVRTAAALIARGAGLPLEAALTLELHHLQAVFSTRDARHGLSSLGRAAPVFEGR